MTIKEFLAGKTLEAVETVNDSIIINIVVNDAIYGIDVDTSNIPCNTLLKRVNNFTLIGDIIKVSNIEIDTSVINMLGDEQLSH